MELWRSFLGIGLVASLLLPASCSAPSRTQPASNAAASGGSSVAGSVGTGAPVGDAPLATGGAPSQVTPGGGTGGLDPEPPPNDAGAGGLAAAAGATVVAVDAGAASDAGPSGNCQNTLNILHTDFALAPVGPFAQADVERDFCATATWNDGLDEGRAEIVEEEGNRFLRVTYTANQYGPANNGVQFKVDLGGNYEQLYLSYRVRFAEGFTFMRGGKLPGLIGGTAPTGCRPDDGGFSARNMWREGGALVQYLYYPGQPNTCGDNLYYGDQQLQPGNWHTVVHRLVMNTAGQADGILQGWLDGTLGVDESDRLWRNSADYGIDMLYFSTFFGGSDASWAPQGPQHADYDDFVVSEQPL